MNIVTPIPTTITFVTANVNTEAARRDNSQRETIPALSSAENSAAETALGSESDKVKTPGQAPPPLTYERPQSQAQQANQGLAQQSAGDKDNASGESAGKEDAEAEQQAQAEQKQLAELKKRDVEVRAHEQSHASLGGQFASAPSYEYETGPDGKRYAVSGEVSIDISTEKTPEETVRKMQKVRAAALAPVEPSAQDIRVAAEASKLSIEARQKIAEQTEDRTQEAIKKLSEYPQQDSDQGAESIIEVPELDEIVEGSRVDNPHRSLNQNATLNAPSDEQLAQRLSERDESILQRVSVIENFYQRSTLARNEGLSLSA